MTTTKFFYIYTFGCQMNKSDSERIAGVLAQTGHYEPIEQSEKADILIFNSCAIRENAELRLFSRIRESNGLRKKTRHKQTLVLAGCVPQYEQEGLLKRYPYIDLIVGTNTIEYLPTLLESQSAKIYVKHEKKADEAVTLIRSAGDQAWVPIMYGCNNYCSYCIVPFTRGREVSRKKEAILEEIAQLKGGSSSEVTLLGQNVNSYGNGLYEDYSFANLLDQVHEMHHVETLSFLTSHPKDMSEELIETIARLPRISREIHVPLQAGDDNILSAMNRGYTYQDYLHIVRQIRKQITDARISSDLIVGFPGETEQHFQHTLRAVRDIGFYRVNTAAFSARKGTAAASLPNQVDETIKHRRLLELVAEVKASNPAKKQIEKPPHL